jgi:hypothetical protein
MAGEKYLESPDGLKKREVFILDELTNFKSYAESSVKQSFKKQVRIRRMTTGL